jgi:hypothetical protein
LRRPFGVPFLSAALRSAEKKEAPAGVALRLRCARLPESARGRAAAHDPLHAIWKSEARSAFADGYERKSASRFQRAQRSGLAERWPQAFHFFGEAQRSRQK